MNNQFENRENNEQGSNHVVVDTEFDHQQHAVRAASLMDTGSLDTKKTKLLYWLHGGWIGWVVLAISLTLTFIAYSVAKNLAFEQEKKRFEYRAEEIETAITERMQVYEQALYTARAMVNTLQGDVARTQWKTFVESMQIHQHWPGIQGLGFAVPVSPENKTVFEQQVRDEGFPDFTIRPEGEREEYSAILFLEPFDWRNQRAFGYDMWSNDTRRQAMKRAKDQGVAATSGIITLVQETVKDIQKGFLMYLPVNDEAGNFTGWVYAAFRANDLMRGILGDYDPSIEFEIFDGDTIKEDSLLFDTNKIYSHGINKFTPVFSSEKHIELQGRTWTLYLSTPSNYSVHQQNRSSQYVLVAGIVIDILLFYLIYSLFSLNKKAQAIAHEMTEEYRLATEREEQANRAKSQFLANMSHELRTPLNSIIGFSHRLIRRLAGTLDEREAEGLRAIHRNGQSLLALISDILDLSKVEAGQMEVDSQWFNVNDIITEHEVEWIEVAKEKQIELKVLTNDNALHIFSDQRKLEQIIRNLMSNAFKYTGKGSVVLTIIKKTVKTQANASQNAIEITVTDTGIGMAQPDLDRLFEGYFRAESVRTQAIQGTGLGLVITAQLVELLGGEINVVSEEGKGSCFSVLIPCGAND